MWANVISLGLSWALLHGLPHIKEREAQCRTVPQTEVGEVSLSLWFGVGVG